MRRWAASSTIFSAALASSSFNSLKAATGQTPELARLPAWTKPYFERRHMLEATRDLQSVTADGQVVDSGLIDGVRLRPARSVLTRSGSLIEVFRSNWPDVSVSPGQVNWVTLWPEGITDWHRHLAQTDHIFPVLGAVRLSL